MSIFEGRKDKSLEQEALLGQSARTILEEPALAAAMEEVELLYMERWKTSHSQAEREGLWARINALDGVQEVLRVIQTDGEHAEEAIRQRNENQE